MPGNENQLDIFCYLTSERRHAREVTALTDVVKFHSCDTSITSRIIHYDPDTSLPLFDIYSDSSSHSGIILPTQYSLPNADHTRCLHARLSALNFHDCKEDDRVGL